MEFLNFFPLLLQHAFRSLYPSLSHLSLLSFKFLISPSLPCFASFRLMIITAPFCVSFVIFTPLFYVSFFPSFVTLFPSTFHTTRSAGLFLSSLYSHAFHCFRLWFLPRSDAGWLLSAVTVSEVTYLFTLLTYLFFIR